MTLYMYFYCRTLHLGKVISSPSEQFLWMFVGHGHHALSRNSDNSCVQGRVVIFGLCLLKSLDTGSGDKEERAESSHNVGELGTCLCEVGLLDRVPERGPLQCSWCAALSCLPEDRLQIGGAWLCPSIPAPGRGKNLLDAKRTDGISSAKSLYQPKSLCITEIQQCIPCHSIHCLMSEQPFGGRYCHFCGWAEDTELRKSSNLPRVTQQVKSLLSVVSYCASAELCVRLKYWFCIWWQCHVHYAK